MLGDMMESYHGAETEASEEYDRGVEEFAKPHNRTDDEVAPQILPTFTVKGPLYQRLPQNDVREQVNCETCHMD